jgi:hypothetical protein
MVRPPDGGLPNLEMTAAHKRHSNLLIYNPKTPHSCMSLLHHI